MRVVRLHVVPIDARALGRLLELRVGEVAEAAGTARHQLGRDRRHRDRKRPLAGAGARREVGVERRDEMADVGQLLLRAAGGALAARAHRLSAAAVVLRPVLDVEVDAADPRVLSQEAAQLVVVGRVVAPAPPLEAVEAVGRRGVVVLRVEEVCVGAAGATEHHHRSDAAAARRALDALEQRLDLVRLDVVVVEPQAGRALLARGACGTRVGATAAALPKMQRRQVDAHPRPALLVAAAALGGHERRELLELVLARLVEGLEIVEQAWRRAADAPLERGRVCGREAGGGAAEARGEWESHAPHAGPETKLATASRAVVCADAGSGFEKVSQSVSQSEYPASHTPPATPLIIRSRANHRTHVMRWFAQTQPSHASQ